MGTLLSHVIGQYRGRHPPRRRTREEGSQPDEDVEQPSHDEVRVTEAGARCRSDTENVVSTLLSLRYMSGAAVGEHLCRSVVVGPDVERVYGCHVHLYPSEDPARHHGTTLGWVLADGSSIGALELLTLARVANTCRKTALLTDGRTCGIVLQYTADL